MFSVTYCSVQGKSRSINEDAILIRKDVVANCGDTVTIEEQESFLLAVADGMGGYAKGDVAASMVLHHLANVQPSDARTFIQSLIEVKQSLEAFASQNKVQLGTAFAGVLYDQKSFLIINVGDCRVYKVTSEMSVLLSRDHTLVRHLQDLDVDEHIIQRQQNILTSAITGGMGNEDFEIYQKRVVLQEDEQLLLCSDGFWSVFEADIPKIARSKEPLTYLKQLLKRRDVDDDCSFVLLRKEIKKGKRKSFFDIIKTYCKKRCSGRWNSNGKSIMKEGK